MFKRTAVFLAISLTLSGCVEDGNNGSSNLIKQTPLAAGDESCFQGGVQIKSGTDFNSNSLLDDSEVTLSSHICNPTTMNMDKHFNRIATFPVCSQIDASCNTATETSAEIVAASSDGMTLIYTDSPQNQIGFTDITNPSSPTALGTLALSGEPTSVTVLGQYALVAVNTSTDFINVSGQLAVINIATQSLVTSINLGGQPDSIAVSKDGAYAAVVIENERDEDLGNGEPPQLPAGGLVIVDLVGNPTEWTTRNIDMTGIADLYSGDPEPEYVDINNNNIAVVTLQENNHLVLVDLANGNIVNEFSAGTVNLDQIDATEGKPMLLSLTESQTAVPREPDGVSWINNQYFATADEGDLNGGSRGFTIFNTDGDIVYSSGNKLDHLAVRMGHYPDKRSGNKGNEPENIDVASFGEDRYLFVASERSSLVFVYDIADPTKPMLKQTLPAGVAPEGVLALPSRNLLIAASEKDNRGDKMRSALNIYHYANADSAYPTIVSTDRFDGTPIPWSALSGLSADPMNNHLLYTVEDSFYAQNRIMTLDISKQPAKLIAEARIMDSNNVFANITTVALADTSVATNDPSRIGVFDEADLAVIINSDKSINIDPEGVAKAADGGFWVASEGNGTMGDAGRPINSLNFLIKTDANAVIEKVVTLPDAINANQLRFGFEGVTEYNSSVYVAFQRVWAGDSNARIGIYDTVAMSWSFLFYPLETPTSQNGGWVGLSDITSLGNGEFLMVERDNQGGPDAAIKRLYKFDATGLVDGDTVSKTLVRDLMSDLAKPAGLTAEKVEGAAVMSNGDVYIINDNDGVDDHSGETQLINLGKLF